MFGEKARRINELELQVAELEEERESFAPFMADAQAIHAEVSKLMSQPGTTENIAQRAFETVLATRRAEVENKLREQHINDNVDDLLDAATDSIALTDGERLAAEAFEMVQSDAKLASAIAERARQLVWQEALERIADSEKKAAEEALLLEEERRIFFNKLNVQFEFDGEMDLADTELLHYLKHGDKLMLNLYSHNADQKADLELTWRDASEDIKGWFISNSSERIWLSENQYNSTSGGPIAIPRRYISVPTTYISYRKYAQNIIKDDMQIGMYEGKNFNWLTIGGIGYDNQPVVTGCRLETKKIESLEPSKKE